MSGEKTEKATPKKQKDLRKKGTSARSMELPAGIVAVAAVLMMPSTVGRLKDSMGSGMSTMLGNAGTSDLVATQNMAVAMAVEGVRALAPLLVVLVATAILASVIVTRSRPNPHMIKPQFNRISPKAGVKRLVGTQSLFDGIKAAAKLGLLLVVTASAWKYGYERLMAGPGDLDWLLTILGESLSDMLLRAAVLALFVGIADAVWSRRKFNKQAKMSKHDVKEEGKSQEGNPHVKSAMRQRAMKLSRSRMMAAVAGADVILANPTHLVVALKYEEDKSAPVIVAKGAGIIADKIKEKAKEHDVPIVPNKPLARAIYKACDVDDVIPVELYRAVAEVLASIYRARRGKPRPASTSNSARRAA